MPDPSGVQGPSEATQALAATSDVQLIAELRDALVAVAFCGDAWFATLPREVERYDRPRVELLGALRLELVLAGPAATTEQLAALAEPIINPYWLSGREPAASLAEAVEALRHLTMHRLPAVRAARAEVGRWRSDR
ncbi:hypothetical protein OHA72_22180 [Dactylosporangium sp. NBC_01737]|uniref:hypothetical protein n=1 Tax=Dactylosporangium sp. NBC_01737 TaxID=2975959 RepID=UPI002E0E1738|nr:hypothetical protein OHA72_22180 [Dactylosporangium sp. NBC_01737]